MMAQFARLYFMLNVSIPRILALETSTTDSHGMAQPAEHWKWGTASNGVVGGVCLKYQGEKSLTPKIAVYVHEVFDTNRASPTVMSEARNENPLRSLMFGRTDTELTNKTSNAVLYVKWIERFCGPMVLKDASGTEVCPKHPSLCSFQSYPPKFSQTQLSEEAARRIGIGSVPTPEILLGRMPLLASFDLDEHFLLTRPGEYQLTVWPRIYKRAATNDDFWIRIEVPPVTISIAWTGSDGK